MSWEAVASLAELIGAVAVVVSLIYLARQVQAGTRELRTTIRDSTFQQLSEWNYHIMSDPDLAWIFQSGCRDFHSVDERSRARLVHVMYSFFKMFENIYLHSLDRSVEENVWTYNAPMLLAYARQPGAQYYLSHREQIFDPRFWTYLKQAAAPNVPDGYAISAPPVATRPAGA